MPRPKGSKNKKTLQLQDAVESVAKVNVYMANYWSQPTKMAALCNKMDKIIEEGTNAEQIKVFNIIFNKLIVSADKLIDRDISDTKSDTVDTALEYLIKLQESKNEQSNEVTK